MIYWMKMLPRHHEALIECLNSNTGVEQGCFALCAVSRGKKRTSLLIKDVITLAAEDFVVQEELRLSVSPSAMLRIARKAQDQNLAMCMIHTHPMCDGHVEFSDADESGNLRTFPFFHRMQPEMLHSCLVWNKGLMNVSGRIYFADNSWVKLDGVEIVGLPGNIVTVGENGEIKSCVDNKYHRQALLLGEKGQDIVGKKRIGIIGQGGLGSCVTLNAVHTGFKAMSCIDFDVIEKHNLPRIAYATVNDVDQEVLKVAIGKRYAESYDSDIEFIALPCPVENPSVVRNLKDCDALIVTTDNTRSRAYINQFCQQHYIPLLDLGVEFVADKMGEIVNDVGKVNLVLPGTACMQCSMHIDPERLRSEALPEKQREIEVHEGYIRGMDIRQPSMMIFNMEVAARGIQVLVGYFTGLFNVDNSTYESYSFLMCNGRRHHKLVKKRSDFNCPFCSANSVYLGAGDAFPMLIVPLREIG